MKLKPQFLLQSHIEIEGLFCTLFKIGFKPREVYDWIMKFPDLILQNKSKLFEQKMAIFQKMQMNAHSTKSFVTKYPTILLK